MKVTVELPGSLLRQAKRYAVRQGIPLREVFEAGLRAVVDSQPPAVRRFRLKTITTEGEGLCCAADWNTIRSTIYESHGG